MTIPDVPRDVSPAPRPPDAPAPRTFTKITTASIFEPLPPTPWICEGLGWCPGRPAMIAGYGYSGKTLAAQCAALQLAAERSVWGAVDFKVRRPMRVLHLDYEQGRGATLKRYQRLARGLDIGAADLGVGPDGPDGRLVVVSLASVKLNDHDAQKVFEAECKGFDVVILDAFRGSVPGVDENESKVRDYLDRLTAVSESTGAAFVIIHHAGKSRPADGRMVLRGSSAIFDACGAVLTLAGAEGRDDLPKEAEQVKNAADAERGAIEPFGLRIRDVQEARGVCVEYVTREQVKAAKEAAERDDAAPQPASGQRSNGQKGAQRGGFAPYPKDA